MDDQTINDVNPTPTTGSVTQHDELKRLFLKWQTENPSVSIPTTQAATGNNNSIAPSQDLRQMTLAESQALITKIKGSF